MGSRCPFLRLEDSREQVLVEPSRNHRCFRRYRPERVGLAYQAETCLTTAYRRCTRLVATAGQGDSLVEKVSLPRPVAPPPRARRPMTNTEFAVLALGVSLLLALLFVGAGVVYRLVAGPAPEPTALVAEGPEPTAVEVLPTHTLPAAAGAPVALATESVSITPVVSPTHVPELPVSAPAPYVRAPATSPPTRIVIPKIDLDVPVLPVDIKTIRRGGRTTAMWDDVPNAGGFHETSAYPGTGGNTVINGHRDMLGSVFRHLDRMDVGDEITLYVGDVAYPYIVAETLVVPEVFASAAQRAENLRLIGAMPEERLTLVTCTPVGLATHRLLVIAKPPQQAEPGMPGAGSDTSP
jgi:sortase A